MNKKMIVIYVVGFMLVFLSACTRSYAEMQKDLELPSSYETVVDEEFSGDTYIPPEEYLCETYVVGGEILSFSEWVCYNGENSKGEILTNCINRDDDMNQKVFPDEHYVCAEDE